MDTKKYNQEDLINDLKKYTIDNVLEKYGLSWSELFKILNNKPLYSDDDSKYISRNKSGKYTISKVMDKEVVYYGQYDNRSDAECVVHGLKKHYWNKDKLGEIVLSCKIGGGD